MAKEVQIHDKHFSLFISEEEIFAEVKKMAKQLEADYPESEEVVSPPIKSTWKCSQAA